MSLSKVQELKKYVNQLNHGKNYNLGRLLRLQAEAIVELADLVEPLAANTQVIVTEVEVPVKDGIPGLPGV